MTNSRPYQSVHEDGAVFNHHPYGRDITRLSEDINQILSADGVGPESVGASSQIVARAMLLWIKFSDADVIARLVSVGRPGFNDHIAVEVVTPFGFLYLDQTGVARASELRARMKRSAVIFEAVIEPFDKDYADAVDLLSENGHGVDLQRAVLRLLMSKLDFFSLDLINEDYLDTDQA